MRLRRGRRGNRAQVSSPLPCFFLYPHSSLKCMQPAQQYVLSLFITFRFRRIYLFLFVLRRRLGQRLGTPALVLFFAFQCYIIACVTIITISVSNFSLVCDLRLIVCRLSRFLFFCGIFLFSSKRPATFGVNLF